MEARTFTRQGNPPHLPSLAGTVTALLGAGRAGSFSLSVGPGVVVIEQSDWAGVDLAAVQAAVTAAPDDTPELRAQGRISDMTVAERAVVLALLDLINVERARHAVAGVTLADFFAAAKTKAAAL